MKTTDEINDLIQNCPAPEPVINKILNILEAMNNKMNQLERRIDTMDPTGKKP